MYNLLRVVGGIAYRLVVYPANVSIVRPGNVFWEYTIFSGTYRLTR